MGLLLRRTPPKGMSLLELLLVLAVLSGVLAVSLPSFLNTVLPRYRLKNAAERLVGDMLYARALAVKTNLQHRIVFDTNNNAYWMEVGDRSAESKTWSRKTPVARFSDAAGDVYFPGVELVEVTASALVFRPTGGQTALSVTMRDSRGQSLKIVTAMAGRIRMERLG